MAPEETTISHESQFISVPPGGGTLGKQANNTGASGEHVGPILGGTMGKHERIRAVSYITIEPIGVAE